MEHTQSFHFFNRGPSPVVRLVFFLLLSLLLLFIDARYNYLGFARSALSVPVQSLQHLTTLPGELLHKVDTFLVAQSALLSDNAKLREQHFLDAAQLQQLQTLQAENQQLNNLLQVQKEASYPMHLAKIAYVEHDIFTRKLLLVKDAQANVQAGQVVIDDRGVVGQVTRVYPLLNEATLITDKDHAVPVQVLRNGLRAVVFGSGDISELSLRYMPISSDIQEGDMLVTSGIDGTYPPGLPVARVNHIERDPAYPFARIQCTPVAGVDKHRYLLILTGLPQLPPRPEKEQDRPVDNSRKGTRKNP